MNLFLLSCATKTSVRLSCESWMFPDSCKSMSARQFMVYYLTGQRKFMYAPCASTVHHGALNLCIDFTSQFQLSASGWPVTRIWRSENTALMSSSVIFPNSCAVHRKMHDRVSCGSYCNDCAAGCRWSGLASSPLDGETMVFDTADHTWSKIWYSCAAWPMRCVQI